MFTNLAKFETRRSGKQALGFYIAYLFLGIILGAAVGGIAGALNPAQPAQAASITAQIISVIFCLALAVAVSSKRGLFSSFKTLLLIAMTALLSLFLGALGGLIPVAYLTTVLNEDA